MSSVIMSGQFPEMAGNLQKYGFEIIFSEELGSLYKFESRHADMQCLRINDAVFVHRDSKFLAQKLKSLGYTVIRTQKSLSAKYPENVKLNAVYLNNILYCRKSAADSSLIKYCDDNKIEVVNVNQGYAKCSTAVIDNSFITADRGIFAALSRGGAEGLLINSGSIDLEGVDYGFIGGCCFSCDKNVYFTGNIALHPDCIKIEKHCEKLNKNIVCLSNDKLYDIGGFIVV